MSSQSETAAAALLQALRSVLGSLAEPSQVLKTILGQAVSQTRADRGIFVEVQRGGHLAYRVLYRFEKEQLSGEAGQFSRNLFSKVLESGEGVRLENALDDPRFGTKQSVQALGLVSVLCMPIKVEGRVAALVHLESNTPGHFREEHARLLESLGDVAAPALATLSTGEGVLRERDDAKRALVESRERLSREWSFSRFIGRSAAVRTLEKSVARAAESDFPALLLGESGTGKSIVARVLHHCGARSASTFVTVFCPSLEKGMVETELFGHKRGAFTGADADRAGKVQAAEGGTLFLDEIGELPMAIQPKLLRLLQERTYERVGDAKERSADVRVIAATNRDLSREVQEGRFRRDLFERLNFVPIRVPALRERREDIPILLEHFLEQDPNGRWIELTDETRRYLVELDFAWPGNVRHVEQLAVRLSLDRPEASVRPDDIRRLLDAGAESSSGSGAGPGAEDGLELGLPALLAKAEQAWLEEAMRLHPDVTRATLAAKLKISEAALYKKLKRYDLGGSHGSGSE